MQPPSQKHNQLLNAQQQFDSYLGSSVTIKLRTEKKMCFAHPI